MNWILKIEDVNGSCWQVCDPDLALSPHTHLPHLAYFAHGSSVSEFISTIVPLGLKTPDCVEQKYTSHPPPSPNAELQKAWNLAQALFWLLKTSKNDA